jgi:2-methylcitrate dehydratase PrpD
MGRQIEGLAAFAANTRWEDVPRAVQQHTKLVILDTLGVILAGSIRDDVTQLRARLAPSNGLGTDPGATILARGWPRSDVRTAALINGIAGRSIELCDGLRLVSSQPAIQILPGVLAAGEQARRSGRDMLTAFLVGYDIAGRLCTAFTSRPLAHQNGQATLLAAVAAAARVQGFDAALISRTMRIATTLLLTPSYTNAVHGATTLNVAGGMSGFAAALAPDLALSGFEAQDDAIEEALGQLVGSAFRPEGLLDELGTRWEITRNYFRLYACCNPIHPALDALKVVLARFKPKACDIERIDFATYRFASVMRNPDPPNYFGSKYSLPHAAATMLVRGSAGYAALDDSSLDQPEIVALRHRVNVVEDAAMSAAVPKDKPARVTVVLKDGRSDTHEVRSHRGDFNEPFSDTELREKFRELAATVLTAEGVDAVEHAVDHCEDWTSVREITELLRKYGRN